MSRSRDVNNCIYLVILVKKDTSFYCALYFGTVNIDLLEIFCYFTFSCKAAKDSTINSNFKTLGSQATVNK